MNSNKKQLNIGLLTSSRADYGIYKPLLKKISNYGQRTNKEISVLLEVNTSKEKQKYGFLPEEIDKILSKLESQNSDLIDSLGEYQRLIQLNKHIDSLFKKKFKEISSKQLIKND